MYEENLRRRFPGDMKLFLSYISALPTSHICRSRHPCLVTRTSDEQASSYFDVKLFLDIADGRRHEKPAAVSQGKRRNSKRKTNAEVTQGIPHLEKIGPGYSGKATF